MIRSECWDKKGKTRDEDHVETGALNLEGMVDEVLKHSRTNQNANLTKNKAKSRHVDEYKTLADVSKIQRLEWA